jgi:hypothetical protein
MMRKPILLHCGDDIKWNHELYTKLSNTFDIKRSHSMGREEFKQALKDNKFGDFVAMYRPFWNTGGEMSPWNSELMFVDSCSFLGRHHLRIAVISFPNLARSTPQLAPASTGSTPNLSPNEESYTAMPAQLAQSPSLTVPSG